MSKPNIPDALPLQVRAAKVSGVDAAARTVTFALTSDKPIAVWGANQILDHNPKSIRQERLKKGIAILFNHGRDQHLGRSTGYEIRDGVLYVTAKFGNGIFADEKLRDVQDEILVDASGGFIIHSYQLEESKDGELTYRVTDWEPVEASLVTIPADASVGVGRAEAGDATYPVKRLTKRDEEGEDDDACDCAACEAGDHADCTTGDCDRAEGSRGANGVENPAVAEPKEEQMTEAEKLAMRAEAAAAERARVNEIHAIQREHAGAFTQEQAETAISGGADVSEVRRSVMANQVAASKAAAIRSAEPAAQVTVDAGDKRAPGITMARTVRALAAGKGDFARAERFATEVMHDPVVARSFASAAASAADGGYALQGTFSAEIIELLRPMAVVRSLGPNIVPLDGTYTQNRLLAGAAGGYIGENQDIPASKGKFGQLKLSAKKLAALVPVSNDLLRRSGGESADAAVRDDLMISLANTEDISFIRAQGTAYSPKGLRYWVLPSNLINQTSIAGLTGGALVQQVQADFGKLKLALRQANIRFIRPGYIISPRTEYFLQNLLNGLGYPIYRDEMASGKLNGYPYRVTTQIPENLTVNGVTGCAEIYFADFADVTIGDAPQIGIEFSTEASYRDPSTNTLVSAFSQDQTVMRVIIEHDLGMRHQEGLAILNGVTWGQ